MIRHTFFDKCNTIIKDSEFNTGLNPVAELNAGDMTSRILLHFNIDHLKEAVANGEMDVDNLIHTIKMKNCGSVNLPYFDDKILNNCGEKKRAASFTVIAFTIPLHWDEGRGYDYFGDYTKDRHAVTSKDGSTWYKAKNGLEWGEEGIYSNETLTSEYYNNYGFGDSFIIGSQVFDNGTEDLELDVTDYVNSILTGKIENYGIGLAFTPRYERGSSYEALPEIPNDADDYNTRVVSEIPEHKIPSTIYLKKDDIYYRWFDVREGNCFISFFTNHTNTFFHPYLETFDQHVIQDDRAKFYIGNKNRLYFFVNTDEGSVNLDELPICTVNDKTYDVKQGGKGVYYAEIMLKKDEVEADTIMIDTWSNIVINGEKMDDVELEFVVLPMENKIMLGKYNVNPDSTVLVPQAYGINDKEKIKPGDIREVNIDFIKEYSYGTKGIPMSAEYKIYVKEGNRQIDVFPPQLLERKFDMHSFVIDTNDLIPNDYYVDIIVSQGRDYRYFDEVVRFTIVDNVTKFYM